ncbi:helix-turn-helix transcriptional regulator with cupin domain [Syntrophotalea carbinolica DSM 2380]|uniref:Helix-turn-helix transcriptional regulator with cupin domain n=1 Tax=Syntrophotalea carbinolica (strain DSM 2380 / NBRC 103641 / GraBd1) TaxID=338963 RepID=Q3A4K5_SYNC1|nr:XRE family transcriptional regulator [Syntrophotalea carbinolica]ABA88702.1 helix-turn-helix transcriptional regulator with cupin domain [Syntrophotalea carbinolica DSM 2380]
MQLKNLIGKKLKAIRLKNNLTIQVVSERAHVSANMISRIERGLTTPSVEILLRLGSVFEKSINYFVEEVENTHEIVHSRPGERSCTVFDDNQNLRTESFTAGLRDPQFTSFYCVIKPHGTSGDADMFHPGDELLYVLKGRLEMTVAGETFLIEEGESLSFKSHLPHRWTNVSETETHVMWVLSPFTTL